MTKEDLKALIKEHYVGISEAIWLTKTFNIADIPIEKTNKSIVVAKDFLKFIKTKNTSNQNLTLEDELFFFSIINKLEVNISLEIEEEDDDEDDDDDELDFFNNPLSKEQKAELKEREQKIFFSPGQKKVIDELITLIDAEFPLVYNGFNRTEFQKAKGRFWNTIGFKSEEYAWISMEAREFLQAVYRASEPFILKKVAEKELIILPDLTNKYANWISENKYKSNKTNLKQYLKENNIKLSNPNVDRVLDSVK